MTSPVPRFADRVALVTGGSRGIGLEVARQLVTEGAKVVLVARDEQRLQSATTEPPLTTKNAFAIRADVRKARDCEGAVQESLEHFGRLDALINAAGIVFRDRTVESMTETEWDDTFDTNVKSMFLLSKFAMPALRESGGTIVNLSSYVGLVGFAGTSAYAASKAAIVNLTRSMALDHAGEGIRVNCVCPGSVDTDMIHSAWRQQPDPELAARQWAAKHPLGRIATPAEVARAVLFLASDDASFITGVALPVDGGITAG